MEDIRLDSVRLIATDDTSKEIIERLRSDGVYGKEDTECQLINMVFVASSAGVENIPNVLSEDTPAKRNVIITINSSLQIDDNANYNSILSFLDGADIYAEIKTLLYLIRINVEIHGLVCFDFNDFFVLAKGRNRISTISYPYKDNIEEAINEIQKIKLQDDSKCLLFFTIEHYDRNGFEFDMLPVKNYLDTFPEKATLYWNLAESTEKQVTLFSSISI